MVAAGRIAGVHGNDERTGLLVLHVTAFSANGMLQRFILSVTAVQILLISRA